MTYLLDTNVVSEIHKRRPDRAVLDWLSGTAPHERHMSVLTLGEIRRWAERRRRRRDEAAAVAMERWLGELVVTYGRRIVPVTAEVADRWGYLGVPDPVPDVDGLLAATALVHDWTVVTRNTSDLEPTGVRTFNPFTPER
jgi:toxin FitB